MFPRLFLYSQGVAKNELERLTLEKFNALKIDYTTCPGQSMNHYGSQANNKHFVEVEGSFLCSPTLGIWFNTDAYRAGPASGIKDAAVRGSGRYHAITICVNGKERLMKEIYLTRKSESEQLTTYQIELPKSKAAMEDREREDREREEKRQKISHPVEEEDAINVVSMPLLPPKKLFLARANADASDSVTAVTDNGKRSNADEVVTVKLKLASEVFDQTLEATLSRGNAEVEASNAAKATDADDDKADAQNILSVGTRFAEEFYIEEEAKNVPYEGTVTGWNPSSESYNVKFDDDGEKEEISWADMHASIFITVFPSVGSVDDADATVDDAAGVGDESSSVQGEEGTRKRKRTTKITMTQHRANNQISFNSGFDSKDKEGDAFLEKNSKSCLCFSNVAHCEYM